MAKTSTPTPSASSGTSATGAASTAVQGTAGAPAAAVPGATAAAQRTPSAASRAPEGTSLPVQSDDGTESMLAWALAQAGVDGPTDAPTRKPATAKPSAAAATDDDDDLDDEDAAFQSRDDDDEDAKQASPETAATDDAFDPDAPVLGEDAEEAAPGDEEDDDDTDPKTSKLKKDNFKLREKRRELQEALAAKDTEIQELRKKLEQTALPDEVTPQYDGYFAGVKSPADVDAAEDRIQQDLDFLEDHPDGYEYQDERGNTIAVTPEQVKAYRRAALQSQRLAARVRDHLQKHQATVEQANQAARKKYPFVFDPKHPRNSVVLDLAKEFPSLSRHPQRALLLGRLAVAKLVESGEYTLARRGQAPAAGKPTAPSPSSSPAPSRRLPSQKAAPVSADPDLGKRIAAGDADALERAALALLEG